MKQNIHYVVILLLSLTVGCSSGSNTDNTAAWLGTYSNGINSHNGVNRISISRIDNNTVKVLAQIDSASTIFTIATFQKGIIVSSSTLAINEETAITTIADSTFHFVLSGSLTANTLIFSGSATNDGNSSDVKNLYFIGSK
jgi:hypothetical protein